ARGTFVVERAFGAGFTRNLFKSRQFEGTPSARVFDLYENMNELTVVLDVRVDRACIRLIVNAWMELFEF
ncbi:5441_t:CDS:1, partial [Acaulospora colombiana]